MFDNIKKNDTTWCGLGCWLLATRGNFLQKTTPGNTVKKLSKDVINDLYENTKCSSGHLAFCTDVKKGKQFFFTH